MDDHYTAWNGQQYPGAPPSDWYRAADGRWWAPNTGPGTGQTSTSGFGAPQSTPINQPNSKMAGLITGGAFLVIAVGLITFAAISGSSSDSTDFEALSPSEQNAEFRRYLDQEGIPIRPETTDAQLALLGQTTCDRASESADLSSWNQSLSESSQQNSLNSSGAQLTDVQVRSVFDASLRIYCPEEASRLGIAE